MSDAVGQAIRQKNIAGAVRLMFDRDLTVRWGYHREGELWDYKRDCPPRRGPAAANAWANLAADVLAFHNQQGGLIFFGIDDTTFKFVGATFLLDSKTFNDQLSLDPRMKVLCRPF